MNFPKLIPARWRTAFAIESIAMICCALKGPLKIYGGGLVRSGSVQGDGYHTLADILPIGVVMGGIWLKRQKFDGYPFKLREAEAILTMAIGLVILYTGLSIGWNSLLGLVTEEPHLRQLVNGVITLPHHEAVRVVPRFFWPLVGLMGGSALQSLLLGREQVAIGRETGEAALVADGKETISDAMVEVAALIGVLLVQGLHILLAEYVIGLVVTYFILHMAFEIIKPSLDVMLKKSLGADVEETLTAVIQAVPGVKAVRSLITFRIGRTTPAVIAIVETSLYVKRHPALRYALTRTIKTFLLTLEDAKDTEIYVVLVEPKASNERLAYLCKEESGRFTIVTDPKTATHLLLCEQGGNPWKGRATFYPIVANLSTFLLKKRVRWVRFHGKDEALARELLGLGIEAQYAYFPDLKTEIGLDTAA